MIVAAFICGPHGADDWILPHKLRVLSSCCDRIFVLLDRSRESEAICRQFPKCVWRHYESRELPMRDDGPQWDEGAMRQMVWDWATQCRPDWVLLGDTDEIPGTGFGALPLCKGSGSVTCWYANWVNLCYDAGHAIGGPDSPWSFTAVGANKKGMLVRYDASREYSYRTLATRHVRLEPSPLHEFRTVYAPTHELGCVPLIHYRWANWWRWQQSEMAALPKYQPWPPQDATIIDVPRHWLWLWDADQFLRDLPEPIAVVGNGPCVGQGAEIDGHATVIRFNNWRTSSDVGCRTDVWCVNCWDDVEPRPWTGKMVTIFTDGEQRDRLSRWLGMYPHMHVPLGPSWVDATRAIKPNKPSTGLVLLNRLRMHRKRFRAFGFDGMTTGHAWDPNHKHDHPPEVEALRTLGVLA